MSTTRLAVTISRVAVGVAEVETVGLDDWDGRENSPDVIDKLDDEGAVQAQLVVDAADGGRRGVGAGVEAGRIAWDHEGDHKRDGRHPEEHKDHPEQAANEVGGHGSAGHAGEGSRGSPLVRRSLAARGTGRRA